LHRAASCDFNRLKLVLPQDFPVRRTGFPKNRRLLRRQSVADPLQVRYRA
jgi:hypothetical protein